MRKFVLLLSLILLGSVTLWAQGQRVSGLVTGPDGHPLAGATVIVSGTSIGTITDQEGRYSINAPADATLSFSLLGMVAQSHTVSGRQVVNVTMDTDATLIDNVVVTALGITRSEKSLGYSVSEVAAGTFEDGRESNILNSLSGKVAGVNIMQNSGTAGGGSKIILRGQTSLSSSGQPLFVIDGVPVSNSSYAYSDNNGAIDAGSRIGDIAGDDIESMNILKGAAATALYGARAKDGVIVITTKKGARNQAVAVSVNSSFRFDSALKLPDYQNEYGPGNTTTGEYSMGNWNGWGPRIEGQTVEIFTGDNVKMRAYPDNVKDFFKGGTTFTNSISMSGGDEKNDFRLGISSTNQKGIVPMNEYNRYNFTFNGGRQFNDWFSGRVSASYITATSEGRPAQGSNDRNVTLPDVFRMPRTMNTQWLEENWITEDGTPFPMGTAGMATTNNPYWVLNKNKYTSGLDRLIGSVFLEVKPVAGLTISNNLGVDMFYENSRKVWAKGTFGVPKGRFETINWNSSTLNNDLLATYNINVGDFDFHVMSGMNLLQETTKTLTVDALDLLLPDIYSYANAEVKTPGNTYRQRRLVGVFGEAGVSYKDLAYLTITGRNDWSSTMPPNHKSYFYPSISGSFIFSELIPQNNILSFGKLRANFAMVGSDTDPYALTLTYSAVNSYFLQYLGATAGTFPHGDLLGYTVTGTYPSPNLEPQMKSEFEVGVDLGFFNQRLRLGLTYYHNLSTKNIARFDTPNSAGFFYHRKNAGEITNDGLEIALGATPFNGAFRWDIDVNFATNRQKVKSLAQDMTEYTLTSGYNGLQIKAAVGEAFSIYGLPWMRDNEGNIVIDATSGLRRTAPLANLGKISPDFTMGINNSFSWKGIHLSFLVDIRQGGVMYSQTAGDMLTSGLGAATLLNDRQPIIDKGVNITGGEGTAASPYTYGPNTTAVKPYDYWSRNFTSTNTEGLIFDASYVKLREVIAGYTLPDKWLGNFPIKDIFLGFEARNLWIIHSNVPHVDPELNYFSTGDVGYGVEFSGIPSTRSFGFNLKFNF